MSLSDGRVQWLKHVVVNSLGATDRAFEYMVKSEDGASKLLDKFLTNEVAGDTSTLCFYASVMELSEARLIHGGKLSGDADGEREPGRHSHRAAVSHRAFTFAQGHSQHALPLLKCGAFLCRRTRWDISRASPRLAP